MGKAKSKNVSNKKQESVSSSSSDSDSNEIEIKKEVLSPKKTNITNFSKQFLQAANLSNKKSFLNVDKVSSIIKTSTAVETPSKKRVSFQPLAASTQQDPTTKINPKSSDDSSVDSDSDSTGSEQTVTQLKQEKPSSSSVNTSSSSDSEDDTKTMRLSGKVNPKPSTSQESSSDEAPNKNPPPNNLKKIKIVDKKQKSSSSSSEDSSSSDENNKNDVKPNNASLKKPSSSSDSEEDTRTPQSRPKSRKSSSSESSSSEEAPKRSSLKKSPNTSRETKSVDTNSNSSSKTTTSKSSFIKPEVKNFPISNKSKVKVLQNISLSPKRKKETLEGIVQKHCPGFARCAVEVKMDPCDLSDSEEFYLLQVPRSIEPSQLKKQQINLTENTKITLNDEEHVMKPTCKPTDALVVTNTSKVIHFKSTIFLEKVLKIKNKKARVSDPKTTVPFPDNLKERHPLFGRSYENKIVLDQSVEEKLEQMVKEVKEKSKKAKKKKKKVNSDETQQTEMIFQLLNSNFNKLDSSTAHKKKKKQLELGETATDSGSSSNVPHKKKRKGQDSTAEISQQLQNVDETVVDNDGITSKTKKKRKKSLTAEMDETATPEVEPHKKRKHSLTQDLIAEISQQQQEIVDPTIDNATKKKRRKSLAQELPEELIQPENVEESSKKHKKRRKSETSWTEPAVVLKEEITPKKMKKKKEKPEMSLVNSTLNPDSFKEPSFNPEVSSIAPETPLTKKSKKKASKKDSDEPDLNLIANLLSVVKSEITTGKKEKKNKKKIH